MATLYQKYRPKTFAEVVDQNHVKITLQSEVETGEIANAYLFSGPRGTGKTTMARLFAKALNCETRAAGAAEPCDKCDTCNRIREGRSLNIIEIDAASHTGVDNVRENIIANARTAVGESAYKVFIIDEVHMLSISAFNALLKIIEEPPERVLFILCTTEAHKLPQTIISRCQRFDFKRISVADVVRKLEMIAQAEGLQVDDGILQAIARQSGGHMRDAESLFGQVISVSGGKTITQEKADLVIPRSDIGAVTKFIGFVHAKDAAGAVRLVNRLVDEGVELKQFTGDAIEVARRLLLLKVSPALAENFAQDYGEAVEAELLPITKETTLQRLIAVIEELTTAHGEIKHAFIAQLPLEIAAVRLCAASAPVAAANPNAVTAGTSANAAAAPNHNAVAGTAEKTVAVSTAQVQEKWNEFLAQVKKRNHSLSFVLRVCEVRDRSGQITLAFKYRLHQDRVEQPAVRADIDAAFKEIFGGRVDFVTELDEQMAPSASVSSGSSESPAAQQPTGAFNELPTEQTKSPSAEPQQPVEENAPAQKQAGDKKDNGNLNTLTEMFGGKVVG